MQQAAAARLRQPLCASIGGARIGQPDIIFQKRDNLRGKIPPLGQKMPRPLAPLNDARRLRLVEINKAFGRHAAIFNKAEGENIHARPPSHVRRRTAQMGDRVRKARAIHMEAQTVRFGDIPQRRDFGRRIDPAIFSGIGDGQGIRLRPMHPARRRCQLCREGIRRNLGPFPVDQGEFGPMGVKFRRAAFIILNMGILMAQHAAIRRAEACKRQRIGGGSSCDPKDRHLCFKQV